MGSKFHFYVTDPIDWNWEHLDDFSPSNPFTNDDALFKKMLDDFKEIYNVATAYRGLGLVCPFSKGPKVFWLPNPGWDRRFEYGFVWKQTGSGNPDGITFIASPYELPWLGLHILSSQVINIAEPVYESFVYFIYAESLGLIKISVSKNPENRLRQMGSSVPYQLEMLRSFPGDASIKRGIHQKFLHLRRHGDWFEATDELRKWIESHGAR